MKVIVLSCLIVMLLSVVTFPQMLVNATDSQPVFSRLTTITLYADNGAFYKNQIVTQAPSSGFNVSGNMTFASDYTQLCFWGFDQYAWNPNPPPGLAQLDYNLTLAPNEVRHWGFQYHTYSWVIYNQTLGKYVFELDPHTGAAYANFTVIVKLPFYSSNSQCTSNATLITLWKDCLQAGYRLELDNASTPEAMHIRIEYNVTQPATRLQVISWSPVDLLVRNPFSCRVGYNNTSGTEYNEIPGAYYTGSGTQLQVITIPMPCSGVYRINVYGRANGSYNVTFNTLSSKGAVLSTQKIVGSAIINGEYVYAVELAPKGKFTYAPVKINLLPTVLNVSDPLQKLIAFIDTPKCNGAAAKIGAVLLAGAIEGKTVGYLPWDKTSIVMFDGKKVGDLLSEQQGKVTLTVSGILTDGTLFQGDCKIKVVK